MAIPQDRLSQLQQEFQSLLLKKLTGQDVNGEIRKLLSMSKSEEEKVYIIQMCKNLNLGYTG